MAQRHTPSDWLDAIFHEDNALFGRRAPRILGLLTKLLKVTPHLFAMAFTNFASTYPRVNPPAEPQPLIPERDAVLDIGSWPRHPGNRDERGLPYGDSVASRLDLRDALSGVVDLVFAMREVHRVCVPGATVLLQPVSHERVTADPTLVRAILPETINFFTDTLDEPALCAKASELSARSLFALERSGDDQLVLRVLKENRPPLRPQRIDLGCGTQVRDGYAGVDLLALPGVAIVRNVDRHGLPFSDSTISHIYTAHFLEHVQDLVFVMNEIHRVCCQDAIVEISVPTLLGPYSAADPTHVHLFNARTLSYFEAGSGEYAGIVKGFQILEQHVGFSLRARLRVVKAAASHDSQEPVS